MRLPPLCAIIATILTGCSSHTAPTKVPNPPPVGSTDVFLVANFSGQLSALSVQSGHLSPVAGSLAQFPFPLDNIAAQPDGSLLIAISGPATTGNNAQTAVLQPSDLPMPQAQFSFTAPSAADVSASGFIAITDENDDLVEILAVQNSQVHLIATAPTGPSPRSALFSADGHFLYVGNSFGSSISAYAISITGVPELRQTSQLPLGAGELTAPVVRLRLNPSGSKLVATTAAGQIYISNVNPSDGTLSATQETLAPPDSNFEEVVFDPSGQNIYTADLANGLIYGFTVASDGRAISLPGSPYEASPGPSGLAVSSQGNQLYVVLSGASEVITLARSTTGELSATGDVVASGGFLPGRIIRVAVRGLKKIRTTQRENTLIPHQWIPHFSP